MNWLHETTRSRPTDDTITVPLQRPYIPDISLSGDRQDATREEKLLAIHWAKKWLGVGDTFDEDEAIAGLDLALAGKRRGYTSPEGRILLQALKALSFWRDASIYARTARSFPWLLFVAIEGSRNCPEARKRNGQINACGGHERIPLAQCNSSRCDCHYLQLTELMMRRKIDGEGL